MAFAEDGLTRRLGISFSTELGAIERVERDVCVISLDSGGTERVPSCRVVATHEKGLPVALERVNVLAKETGYVMPLEAVEDREERELAQRFAKMAAPESTPAVIEPEVSHFEPLPYRRSKPRKRLWHDATTMTRVPLSR